MTIDDPFDEVTYNENFACNDSGNKYLDESTIERILEESKGDLDRENSDAVTSHPNCLRRVKRRKKPNVQLTSRLSQTPSGTIYYRMSEPMSSNETRMKSKSVKLSSKSLEKALREVSRRGLDKFEELENNKNLVISQLFIYEKNLFTSYFYIKHINLLMSRNFSNKWS